MRRIDITDPNPPRWKDRRDRPEEIKLLVSHRVGGTWGEFEPLRGTSWAHGIKEISSEALAHALHGHILPLTRELGRLPHASGKLVSEAEGLCALRGDCPLWDAALCRPGGQRKKELGPLDCYEAPVSSGTNPEVVLMMREVVMAWRENRHTIVAEDGFIL